MSRHSWRKLSAKISVLKSQCQKPQKKGPFNVLRENLKLAIDTLNDQQLEKLAELIAQLEVPAIPLFQDNSLTPEEKAQRFQSWAAQSPAVGVSLSDKACSRESLYE
ncbi:MAG: hypothetical protein ABG776_21955 [Cyanobacteria bacterium J06555_13]